MSRTLELLDAVAEATRAVEMPAVAGRPAAPAFRDVRVELDRYELSKMADESFAVPAARICFLQSKPARRPDGGLDRDVSLAIVVVTGREGRADRQLASADLAAMERLDRIEQLFVGNPYLGLSRLGPAQVGDQLVAVSEASNKKGVAIALVEVTWRLFEVTIARKPVQRALETGREPLLAVDATINDEPLPERPAP